MQQKLSEGAVFAVRSAYLDLLDAISKSASNQSEIDTQTLHVEAERFIVAMLASITLVDGHIDPQEAAFLCDILNLNDIPGGAVRYVNEYACKWSTIGSTPPRFFSLAVKHDRDAAHEMLRMIQIIGNNSAVSDAHISSSEHRIVQDCIAQLEAAFLQEI